MALNFHGMIVALMLSTLGTAQARDWVVAAENPGAADTNPGTAEQPLRTINAAAQLAQPGDRVLVHQGIYRERVIPARGGENGKPIRYEAADGETVSVKGSDVWTHWQPVEGKKGVYSATIEGHIPAGTPNPFLIGISVGPSDANIVARPASAPSNMLKTLGQIFCDGRQLVELNSENAVLAQENSWVVTQDGKRCLAHFAGNPETLSARLIEVTVRNRIFAPRIRGLNYIHISGFTFEHCANQGPFPQGGAVSPRSGSYWVIENNVIRFAKTVGVDVGNETWNAKELKDTTEEQKVRMDGGHDIVQGNVVSDNGLCGIEGWHHNGAVIRNNIVERNNALGFTNTDTKWEEWGGIKLHDSPALIEGNLIRDNDAYGIWLDNNYIGSRITRNVILNNRMAGVFLELGEGRALIDNNIIAFSRPRDAFYGGMGIYAHDASDVVIAHNLIAYNADCGVLLRTVSERVFKGTLVHTSHTRILNNIIWNNSRAAISLPYPNVRADDNLSDFNVLNATRDQWLGFEANPGLFAVNLYKSSLTIDQLEDLLKKALTKAAVPEEEWPQMKAWRRNPTLTLPQWRLLTGQDMHSKESPELISLIIRPQIPMISYKAHASVLQMSCPPVEGVENDFFGRKLPSENILPGPFQNLGATELEAALFPVPGATAKPQP